MSPRLAIECRKLWKLNPSPLPPHSMPAERIVLRVEAFLEARFLRKGPGA